MSKGAPWVKQQFNSVTPKELHIWNEVCNAFGVNVTICSSTQGGAAAPLTLGFGVVPRCGTLQLRESTAVEERLPTGSALGASVSGAHEVVGVLEGDDAEQWEMAGGEGAFDFEVEVVAGRDGLEEVG